jgi:4-hydroxy-tetrahydrodipicolinate synthase
MVTNKQLIPFNGIITPTITPLEADGTLDIKNLERLINHLIEGGVHGIFILGTTGESASMPNKLKKELIEATSSFIKDKIPLLAGITDSSLEESISLAKEAVKNGANAVVAAPPYYFNLNQNELVSYFHNLADKSSLPLFIYNIPSQTKVIIEVESVKTLAAHPNIYGIKDSSGNATYFNTLLQKFHDDDSFSVFVGPDEMMAQSVLMGGNGGVNSGSNLYPKLFVELFNAAVGGDLPRVASLQNKVMEMSSLIYQTGNTGTSFLKGLKMALSISGFCKEYMLSPLIPFCGKEKDIIKQSLTRLSDSISSISKVGMDN